MGKCVNSHEPIIIIIIITCKYCIISCFGSPLHLIENLKVLTSKLSKFTTLQQRKHNETVKVQVEKSE